MRRYPSHFESRVCTIWMIVVATLFSCPTPQLHLLSKWMPPDPSSFALPNTVHDQRLPFPSFPPSSKPLHPHIRLPCRFARSCTVGRNSAVCLCGYVALVDRHTPSPFSGGNGIQLLHQRSLSRTSQSHFLAPEPSAESLPPQGIFSP